MLRKLGSIVVILIVLTVAAVIGGRLWLARSVAEYDGEIATGVQQPVEITFDAKGVPQIWAQTDDDAFFAMGWLHGNERLFQMELVRRLSNGELSELFGAAAFDTDAEQRRLGFGRRAKRDAATLSPRARRVLERYVAGVNAAIEQASVLPPEFVILRTKPRPWTIADCLAISGYQTWFSHQLMDQDRRYQQLIEKLGPAAAALAHAGHPWSPPTVPDAFAEQVLGATKLRATAASNSWAVAPARSQSHAALHASDPHLSVDQAPGLWYLAAIHSAEGLNVAGVTYAGGPFVVMGHNDDIAFSFTVASVDLIDYYDDRALRTIARESIVVKAEARPRVVAVHEGARGVMIDEKTSLKWAGLDFHGGELLDAGLALQRAKTFDDFRRAVTRFGALDANWIYSDRSGNIGYQLGAPVPIRDYDTYVRQPASDANTVWRGYRTLDETPHALNPAEGFVASSNNNVVSPNWPYPLPGFYDPYRIPRARALLSQPRKLSRADMLAFQRDDVSGIATRWKALAVAAAKRANLAHETNLLASWDCRMRTDSTAAALFQLWWRELPRAIFEDDLGDDVSAGRGLVDQALTIDSPLLDDKRTPHVETREEIAARAMTTASRLAHGDTWGQRSTLLIAHPLARVQLLDKLLHLNRGPFPAPGDAGSLDANFTSYDDANHTFASRVGPSMRFVLDWSDVDAFTLTGALGQSGNPFSPHYDDFLPMMRGGESWTVPFSREKVYGARKSLLRLTPR